MIKLDNFYSDECGATAIEYGLMLACVCLTIAGAMSAFSDQFVLAADNLSSAMSVVDGV